jgi:hypothetical protein
VQNFADQHSRHADVVGVFAAARGLFRRVDHRGGLADNAELTHLKFVIPTTFFHPD